MTNRKNISLWLFRKTKQEQMLYIYWTYIVVYLNTYFPSLVYIFILEICKTHISLMFLWKSFHLVTLVYIRLQYIQAAWGVHNHYMDWL